jgi:hypothetical protein
METYCSDEALVCASSELSSNVCKPHLNISKRWGLLQDASLRITAAEFLLRVSELLESDVPDLMDEIHRKHAEALKGCAGQCGCSIM